MLRLKNRGRRLFLVKLGRSVLDSASMKPSIKIAIPSFLIPLAFVLLSVGLVPKMQAVNPPPDGSYGKGNTAEGTNALFSLTTGVTNTALGVSALFSVEIGSQNTAVGANALKTTPPVKTRPWVFKRL